MYFRGKWLSQFHRRVQILGESNKWFPVDFQHKVVDVSQGTSGEQNITYSIAHQSYLGATNSISGIVRKTQVPGIDVHLCFNST